MRSIRIYQPGSYSAGATLDLGEGPAHHVGTVLRMHAGDKLILFPGNGHEYYATILSMHKKKCTVSIDAIEMVNRESPCHIHLAQAISKGERMEWVIQKAVELGVTSLTPLITEHCVVRLDAGRLQKKWSQWQAILIAASEQCGRSILPKLYPVTHFNNYLQSCLCAHKLILSPEAKHPWKSFDFKVDEVTLLIGPEGGFSRKEIEAASSDEFLPISMGPRILRTETAAIAALSVLQAKFGDL